MNIDKEDCPCLLSAIDLAIDWIDEHTTFRIQSHEGDESVVTYDEHHWLTA